MTRLATLTFEAGAAGAAATTGTTGFTAISSGITHVSSPVAEGSRALSFSTTTAVSRFGTLNLGGLKALIWVTAYLDMPSAPAAQFFPLSTNAAGVARASIRINANRTVTLRNGNLAVWTSTDVLATGQEYRFEWKLNSTGSVQSLSVYALHSTTPLFSSGDQTFNTGTLDTVQFGVTTSVANVALIGDWLAIDDAAPTGPAVVIVNEAPTCDAGPDQAGDIEPGQTITLSGTGSDPESGSLTFLWEQIAGTTVELTDADTATATFIAPATFTGDTGTFRLTVTDPEGATGFDDVNVTTDPATEQVVWDGELVPCYLVTA